MTRPKPSSFFRRNLTRARRVLRVCRRPSVAVVTFLSVALLATGCSSTEESVVTVAGETVVMPEPQEPETTTDESRADRRNRASTYESGATLNVMSVPAITAKLEEIGELLEEDHNVTLTVDEAGFAEFTQRFQVRTAAGDAPDIAHANHGAIAEYASTGMIAPVDLGSAENSLLPVTRAAFTYEGELYGAPFGFTNLAFVYNAALFDMAGEEPPQDWTEIREASERMQRVGVVDYGLGRIQSDVYHFLPILTGFGGSIFEITGDGSYDRNTITIDGAGAVAAAEWVDQMLRDGLVPTDMDWTTHHDSFVEGNTAMILTGPWSLATLREAGIRYTIAPIPGDGWPYVDAIGLVVSSQSDHAETAAAFLADYVADDQIGFELASAQGYLPAGVSAASLIDDEDREAFWEIGRAGHPLPFGTDMDPVWSALGQALSDIEERRLSPERAFERAASQIRQSL